MAAGDKSKLDGIAAGAQVNPGVVNKLANGLAPKLPDEAGTSKFLRQDGSWQVPPDSNTTYGVVNKSANGLVPQLPNETATSKFLRQDGTWQIPPDSNTTYSEAAAAALGLIRLNGSYAFTGILTVPSLSLPS
jgi:hypothetical protein